MVVEYFDGFVTKVLYDAVGELFANSLNRTRGEVSFDGFCGGGRDDFIPLDLELFAVAGVENPGALDSDVFVFADRGKVAGDDDFVCGYIVRFFVQKEDRHGVAVVIVPVDDTHDGTFVFLPQELILH